MATKATFFPVGNGDMILIKLDDEAGTTILIDCNIRQAAADDDDHETRDVAADLRERLSRDADGRPYVDAFLLSHPDTDHCRGLRNHFYLGPLKSYPDDKKVDAEKRIVIREVWSSPIVFRRASKEHILCEDAAAFNAEAKRRVKANRDNQFSVGDGDRILILGEDEDGKTDDLDPILIKVDEVITKINGAEAPGFAAQLLAPLVGADEKMDEELTKNNSSVIVNIELAVDNSGKTTVRILIGGDAEVGIWELLWDKHKGDPSVLEYDLLQTPHHCSWHSLSHDSWSESDGDAEVSTDARSALSQIRTGGKIVASSCPIKDDDNDPPCWGAKLEYEDIAEGADGSFYCTGEYPKEGVVAPMEFEASDSGFDLLPASKKKAKSSAAVGPAVLTSGVAKSWGTREPAQVQKEGGGRYA